MNPTNEDLLALEERAKKATKGPWQTNGDYVEAETGYEVCLAPIYHRNSEEQQANNRQYIAAANPAVVLALINKVRELEQKNLRLSSISAENYNKLTGWMDACLKAEATLRGAQAALRKALPYLPADAEAVFVGEWLDEINEAIDQATGTSK